MIVTQLGSDLRLVTQPDHARLAGEILSLWYRNALPTHPRREELLFAVREHDNGWWETDAAPRADPANGRPVAFPDLPDEERRTLWRRGTRRHAADRPWASLLIAEHGLRVHRDRRGDPAWEPFLAELEELRPELLSAAEATVESGGEALEADYGWLELADALSLAACGPAGGVVERPGLEASWDGERLVLEPFPLAGATTFRVACRTIPDRFFRGDADLGGELAAARWTELAVRVVPGGA
jgi:Protein of unknown function (DUF3891)